MRLVLLFFFALSMLQVRGQSQNFRFNSLSSDDGLSSSWVTCVVQDDKGYIWIGTGDGLNRYDGISFETFKHDPKDSTSLYSNFIYSLFIDDKGVLWVGTSKGVNTFDSKSNSFHRNSALPNYSIYDIAQDDKGNMLFGSQNFFVMKKGSKKPVEYFPQKTDSNSISSGLVNTIFTDSRKNIWVGTKNGLNLFDPRKGTFVRFYKKEGDDHSLNDDDIRSITEDKNHTLWIGTAKGLNALQGEADNPDAIRFVNYLHKPSDPASVAQGAVLSLHCDRQNTLWIGTENGGLDILNLNTHAGSEKYFNHYKHDKYNPGGITNNSIQAIYEDQQGNIWLGTYAGGVNLYCKEAKQFNTYTNQAEAGWSINNSQVNVFLEDEYYVWIGTEGGLNRYDKQSKKYTYFIHDKDNPSSIGANAVWALAKDHKGQLWVGTWGGGLSRYDSKSEGFFNYQTDPSDSNSINSNNVFSIYPDQDGSLWVGTMGGGLNHFDPRTKTFRHFTNENSSIPTNYVEDIKSVSAGQLLLANVNGVTVFDKKENTFEPLSFDNARNIKLDKLNVFTIYPDSRKNIWLGTEAGLYVIASNGKAITHYTVAEGLPNNSIKSILEDRHGNLWLGSNSGLSRFEKAVQIPQKAEISNYSIQDGLQGNEFNRRACMSAKTGVMYFGGVNGYNVFNPDSISINSYKPKVALTGFLLSNMPVRIGEKDSPLDMHIAEKERLVLSSDQNSFGFKFAAFNYVSPEKNSFAYKLQGFDEDWKYSGNLREANYTNISPGDYTFLVKASNNDGVWNEQPVSIKLTILPPIWRTPWAYLAYGGLFLLLLMLYRRYSLIEVNKKNQLLIEHLNYTKQEEINQAKLNFFTNLSHEIRTPLTLIKAPVEDLLKDSELNTSLQEQLQTVYQNIKRLSHLVNQLLDFRKIDASSEKLNASQNNIIDLIYEIMEAFQVQKKENRIDFTFKHSEEQILAWYDAAKLTTVLYNLLSNAIKFSTAPRAIVIEVKTIKRPLKTQASGLRRLLNKQHKEVDFLEIRVQDQGIGIPKDQLKNIFNRYYQVFESGSARVRGTGIGLNITKEYIELHGGQIWSESTVGQGSTFVFQIPSGNQHLKPEQIVHPSATPADQPLNTLIKHEASLEEEFTEGNTKPELVAADNKPLVLLVEDNKELIAYLEQSLKQEYTILKAYTGLQGLEMAQKYNPDLLITDVMMPEMDGLSMTSQLKTDLDTSHIPVIMLTAKAYEDNVIEGIEHGADAYIAKPFNTELLKVYVVNILNGRKKLQQKYQQQMVLEPGELPVSSVDEKFLKKLIEVVEENIPNPEFSVNDLSADLNMSYRVLARKVKALTNQTVNEFIRSFRLKRAALLLTKGLPVSEVSDMTGFNDPAYFSRCFQKEFGVAPSQYAERGVPN